MEKKRTSIEAWQYMDLKNSGVKRKTVLRANKVLKNMKNMYLCREKILYAMVLMRLVTAIIFINIIINTFYSWKEYFLSSFLLTAWGTGRSIDVCCSKCASFLIVFTVMLKKSWDHLWHNGNATSVWDRKLK